MKKIVSIIASIMLSAAFFTSCGKKADSAKANAVRIAMVTDSATLQTSHLIRRHIRLVKNMQKQIRLSLSIINRQEIRQKLVFLRLMLQFKMILT